MSEMKTISRKVEIQKQNSIGSISSKEEEKESWVLNPDTCSKIFTSVVGAALGLLVGKQKHSKLLAVYCWRSRAIKWEGGNL